MQSLANIHEIFQNIYHVDLLYVLRSGVLSYFCTPYTCLVIYMVPANVQIHNRYLMRHSEFLHGSRMICISLNILRKTALASFLQKARGGRDSSPSSLLIRGNTHVFWRTKTIRANGDQLHFSMRIPILYLATIWFILSKKPMFWL